MMSTRLHGVIDYAVALLLLAAPYLFGFASGGIAQYATEGLGVFVLIYSLATKYELGAFRILPFSTHLVLDVVFAIALAASPWVLGFSKLIWWPHLAVGIAAIIVVALSTPQRNAI